MKKLKQLVSQDNLTISISSTPPSIPVDLIIEILSRLPLKSVARFRCLSKSWASILTRPYFTNLFLTNSLNHPRLLFTIPVYGRLVFFSAPQTPNPHGNSSLVTITSYKTNSTYNLDINSVLHGLVCCQDWRKRSNTKPVICCPATGEILALPEVKTDFCRPKFYCGYDPTNKKIKVLCLSGTSQARVLTLETGKLLWRMIECKPHYVTFFQGQMICIDGVLYYLARFDSQRSTKSVIVCFDVRSEKFSFINIDCESMAGSYTLINYKDRLGAVQFTGTNQRTLSLWLLEDAGINKWSKEMYELPRSWKHPCTNQ